VVKDFLAGGLAAVEGWTKSRVSSSCAVLLCPFKGIGNYKVYPSITVVATRPNVAYSGIHPASVSSFVCRTISTKIHELLWFIYDPSNPPEPTASEIASDIENRSAMLTDSSCVAVVQMTAVE